MGLKIILADDHKLMREGLRSLIEEEPNMTVIAEATDGLSAVQLAAQLAPDIILMDISMPLLNGIEATHRIVGGNTRTKVIALSMLSDRHFVKQMLSAGASGYVLKDCAFEEVCRAINVVAANSIYLSPQITEIVLKDYVHDIPGDQPSFFLLTPKEREVLKLLAEGKTTQEIASLIGMSIKTVETHRRQIMKKLDIHSIAELTKFAIREGLTTLQ